MLYLTTRRASHLLARLLYRIEIAGTVPPGPVAVAANHESLLDPLLLALAARQPLHFLAKVELWRDRPGGWLMNALGGIPVERAAPTVAAARALTAELQKRVDAAR